MEELLTPAEFAALIKEKYPEYKDVEDNLLVEKMLTKYPEYQGRVDFGQTEEPVKKKDSTDSESPSPDGDVEYGENPGDVPIWTPYGTFSSEATDVLARGIASAGSNLAQIPSFVNEQVATLLFDDETMEAVNAIEDVDQRRRAINKAMGLINPIAEAVAAAGQEKAEEFQKDIEGISKMVTQYEGTITEDLGNFRFGQAGERLALGVVETIPSIIQAMVPYVGLASIGVGSGADKSRRLQEDGEDLGLATSSNAIISGAAEAVFERFTGKMGRNAFRGLNKALGGATKEVSEKAAKEWAEGLSKSILANAGKEGATEVATEITNRLADSIITGDEDAWNNAWSELSDVFLIGAAAGTGMSSLQRVGTINQKEDTTQDEAQVKAQDTGRVVKPANKKEAKQYQKGLNEAIEKNPETYWSVDPVTDKDIETGTALVTEDGGALVAKGGDIKGVYKAPDAKKGGLFKDLIPAIIEAGGVKLDNFDNYLTGVYEDAGFRVIGRTAFNEEFAPKGWNEQTDGKPDIVAMVYDPTGALKIEEKQFDSYDALMKAKNRYGRNAKAKIARDAKKAQDIKERVEREVPTLRKILEAESNTKTSKRIEDIYKAEEVLKNIAPDTKFEVYEDAAEFAQVAKESGVDENAAAFYDAKNDIMVINGPNSNTRTVAHETFHAVLSKALKNEDQIQEASKQLMAALRPSLSPELQTALDNFATSYDEKVANEEKVSELFSILADGYPQLQEAPKSLVRQFLDRIAEVLGIKGRRGQISNKEAVELLNTLSDKFATQESIELSDLDPVQRKTITRIKGKAQKSVKAQASQLRAKEESLSEFGLTNKKNYNVREIGEALQERTRKMYEHFPKGDYSDKAVDNISNYMVDEVIFDIESNPEESAAGWYTEKYQASLDVIAEVDPSLKEKANRDIFTMFLAVTSDGQKVDKNFDLAYRAYTQYKINGQVDAKTFTAGDRTKSIQSNIRNINKLLETKTIEQAKKELLQEAPVGEIKSQANKEGISYTSNFLKDELVPKSAAIFGEKLGMFYANLSGSTGYLTMDRWWSRTFNRYRGELIPRIVGMKGDEKNSKGEYQGLAAFKQAIKKPKISDAKALEESKRHAKNYADKGFKNGTAIEKAANTLYKKGFVELNDAPFNGSDRSFMIETVKAAQKKLKSKGYDMTVADIQAVLWYFEKQLYIEVGGRAPKGISYLDAANKLRDNIAPDLLTPNITDENIEASPDGDMIEEARRVNRTNMNVIVSQMNNGVKMQKTDPLAKMFEVAQIAKRAGISEEAVRQYFKEEGFSQDQIDAAMAPRFGGKIEKAKLQDIIRSAGMTEEEAARISEQMYKEATKAFQNKNLSLKEQIKLAKQLLNEALIDRQYLAKSTLTKAGMDKVVDYVVTSQGASGYAKELTDDVYARVFRGLTQKENDILNQIVFHKRVIDIDTYRLEDRAVLHSKGYTGQSSKKALEGLKKKYADIYDKLDQKSEILFNEYKSLLSEAADAGIISREEFNRMKDIRYQRRIFEQWAYQLDGEFDAASLSRSPGMSDKKVQGLTTGSRALQNMDSWYLFQEHAQVMSRVIFLNRQNRMFKQEYERTAKKVKKIKAKKKLTKKDQQLLASFEYLQGVVVDNPVTGYTKNGDPKFAMDGEPKKGWKALYYYEDGEQRQMIMKDEFHRSFTDTNNAHMSAETRDAVATATGTASVKMMATGQNPAFFVTNLPRDFAFVLTFSPEYKGEGFRSTANPLYYPIAGLKLFGDMVKGVRDVIVTTADYKLAMKYGLSMDFLALQGRFNERAMDAVIGKKGKDILLKGKIKRALDKFNLASEVGFRMAIFKKSIATQLNGRDISQLTQSQQDAIYTKAVRSARELTDFNQGGTVAKTLDAAVPYLNAAIQGTRAAYEFGKKDPVGSVLRTVNLVAYSTAGLMATALSLLSLAKDDEDEEIAKMTPTEVYFATLDSVSEYDLMNYYIIPLGYKNERGDWMYSRIAKQQTLTPPVNYAEHLFREMLAKKEGIVYEQGDRARFVGKTIGKNVSPVDFTKGFASLTMSIPLVDASIAWGLGIDPYTGDPLDWKRGEILVEHEGLIDPNVDGFYKDIGMAMGWSPVRMKATIEAMMTSPSVNPYMGLMYGAADAKQYLNGNKKPQDAILDVIKKTGRRLIKNGSEYNKISKAENQPIPQDIKDEMRDQIMLDGWVKEVGKAIRKGDKEAEKAAIDKIETLQLVDKTQAEQVKKDITKMVNKKPLNALAFTLKYTKNEKVKAYKLSKIFGNSLTPDNVDEEGQALLQELFDEKIISNETLKLYYERVGN